MSLLFLNPNLNLTLNPSAFEGCHFAQNDGEIEGDRFTSLSLTLSAPSAVGSKIKIRIKIKN